MMDTGYGPTKKTTFWGRHETLAITLAGIGFTALFLIACVGLWVGVKSVSRSQRLADERNQTQVNDIQIAQTAQLVKVEQQKAQIRVAQAQGIAKAQEIIKSTLTPAYLQYEAIEAQKSEINSPNHTVIYIPSSSNGVPLVTTVPQQ
jgi:hypothetical protein